MSAKQRRKKKRRRPGASGELPGDVIILPDLTYEITDEPIRDGSTKEPPDEICDILEELHEKIQDRPGEALPDLLKLKKRYGNVPVIFNCLFHAYVGTGDMESAEAVNRECLARFPEYLFGRVNYAMICLRKGEYAKVPGIFEHKFDLKELYPRRSVFHISEFTYFTGAIAMYLVATGEVEMARKCYRDIRKIAPGYPMTRELKKVLYPGVLGWILEKLDARERASGRGM